MKSDDDSLRREAAESAAELGVSLDGHGGLVRHVIFCVGESCCSHGDFEGVWKLVKERCKRLCKEGTMVLATKTKCLKVCCSGPIMLVYPEGSWYHSVTGERAERIVNEHLIRGKVVEEFVFAKNPLAPPVVQAE